MSPVLASRAVIVGESSLHISTGACTFPGQNGRGAPDRVGFAPIEPDHAAARWRQSHTGPAELVAGLAALAEPSVVDALGIPGVPGQPCGLLLCGSPADDSLWTRAGDPAVSLLLVAGYAEDPEHVAGMFPFVARGWWLPSLLLDRIPTPLTIGNGSDASRWSRDW